MAPFALRGVHVLLLMVVAAFVLASPAPVRARDVERDTPPAAPASAPRKPQYGTASVYARLLDGRRTASGEVHDSEDMTAAHRTLPLGTEVRVTNLANHRSVVVRINDRGPNVKSRIIDLSPRAASRLGFSARGKGLARVRLDVIAPPADADAENARSRDATPTGTTPGAGLP